MWWSPLWFISLNIDAAINGQVLQIKLPLTHISHSTPSCTGIYICISEKKQHPSALNITFFQRKEDEGAQTQTNTLTLTCRRKQKSGLQTHIWDKINRWLNFCFKGKWKREEEEDKQVSINSTIKTRWRRKMNGGEETEKWLLREKIKREERLFFHLSAHEFIVFIRFKNLLNAITRTAKRHNHNDKFITFTTT